MKPAPAPPGTAWMNINTKRDVVARWDRLSNKAFVAPVFAPIELCWNSRLPNPWNREEEDDLEEVREAVRVLERMGRVRAEEPAAVLAEHLDRFPGGHGPDRDGLG